MNRSLRTLTIGVVSAVIALGGGAFVASAADHPSFAGSSQQSDHGFGGPPPGGQPPSR